MKNIITFLLSCISLTAVIGQVVQDTRVAVLSQTPTETVLSLSLTGVDQHAVTTPNGEAVVVSFPEGTPLLQAGKPDISKFATALMLPATGTMAISETGSIQAEQLAIDQINAAGGVLGRQIMSPLDLERTFGLVNGDIMHGSLSLDQLFSARPVLGHGDYRAPIAGLYMCGSGTHPGGGVTGAPGHNAAKVVTRDFRRGVVS